MKSMLVVLTLFTAGAAFASQTSPAQAACKDPNVWITAYFGSACMPGHQPRGAVVYSDLQCESQSAEVADGDEYSVICR